jgi:4-aminobutyrate aminotransferase-like enzyme
MSRRSFDVLPCESGRIRPLDNSDMQGYLGSESVFHIVKLTSPPTRAPHKASGPGAKISRPPLVSSAALTLFDIMGKEWLPEDARAMGTYLLAGLNELKTKHECIGNAWGMGFALGLEIAENKTTKTRGGYSAGKSSSKPTSLA